MSHACHLHGETKNSKKKNNIQNHSKNITSEAINAQKPVQYDDLWDRIRDRLDSNLFKHNNKRVDHFVSLLLKNSTQFKNLMEKSHPYLYYLIQEIEKRDMPYELALIPAVESGFDPFAYSNRYAAGLWQITPATSMHYAVKQNSMNYAVKQNWWFNGRRDIMIATQFALTYLKELYQNLQDWELALAAYNAGCARVKRAIKHNVSKGLPITYWDLTLPKQTENYVPKLLAMIQLIKQRKIELTPIPNKPFFELINIGRQIELSQAAKIAGLSLAEMQRLNPGCNRWATDPSGPFTLLMPVSHVELFKQNLKKIKNHEKIGWQCYKVNLKDTLSSISRAFSVPIKVIKHINNLKADNIYTGDSLILPQILVTDSQVTDESKKLYIHRFKATDTLDNISKTYQITINDLTHWNPSLDIKNIKSGSKLNVYLPTYQLDANYHIVEPGESLWIISKRYQISINELISWNQLNPDKLLLPKQKLIVWQKKARSISLPDRYVSHSIIRKVFYVVKAGDSLHKIARKFQLNVSDIKHYNLLTNDHLTPGQTLTLLVDVTRAK